MLKFSLNVKDLWHSNIYCKPLYITDLKQQVSSNKYNILLLHRGRQSPSFCLVGEWRSHMWSSSLYYYFAKLSSKNRGRDLLFIIPRWAIDYERGPIHTSFTAVRFYRVLLVQLNVLIQIQLLIIGAVIAISMSCIYIWVFTQKPFLYVTILVKKYTFNQNSNVTTAKRFIGSEWPFDYNNLLVETSLYSFLRNASQD